MTVLGAQRRAPALVLLELDVELLPAGLRELELLPIPVADLELLELVAQQQVLELRLLLDVDVLAPRSDLVERGLRDEDVPGLDQLRYLAVEEREDQGADV